MIAVADQRFRYSIQSRRHDRPRRTQPFAVPGGAFISPGDDRSIHDELDLQIDPFVQNADFDLKARLTNLQVVRMRDFMRAYTLVDPKPGTLDVVTELSTLGNLIKNAVVQAFTPTFEKGTDPRGGTAQ